MSANTKKRLIQAALTVLAKKPRASMDDIAEAAQVGRATLFRHFRSRKELMRELNLEAERRYEAAVRPILEKDLDARETLKLIVAALIPIGDGFHFLNYEPFHTGDPIIDGVYQRQMQDWKKLVEKLKSEGVIAPDAPTAWAASILEAMIFTTWNSIHDGDIAPNSAPELVVRTFLKGLS